jgi:hypothetical protein
MTKPLLWPFVIVALVLSLFLFFNIRGCNSDATTETTTTTQQTTVINSPQQRQITRTLHEFNERGSVTVEIKSGEASFYPKGGCVIITPPSSSQPWKDCPGIATKEEGVMHPPGDYTISKLKDSKAWGIEIWN